MDRTRIEREFPYKSFRARPRLLLQEVQDFFDFFSEPTDRHVRRTGLALRSKGYWGYDAEFLEACRAELTLAPEDLARLTVRVVERTDGHVVAFYALGPLDGSAGEVCFFFVDPPFMGTGVGRRLFEDLLATARSAGMGSLRIDADPGAAYFYERMGAARVGETPSNSIPGRLLPSYEVTL